MYEEDLQQATLKLYRDGMVLERVTHGQRFFGSASFRALLTCPPG